MPSNSRRPHSSYVPEFDPYGYSPYDPQFTDARQHGDQADRRRGASVDEYGDRSHRTSSRGKRFTPRPKHDYPPEDDDWATDYDPRDVYYLTGDEKEDDDYFSTRKESRRDRHRYHNEGRGGPSRNRSPLADRDHNKGAAAGKTDPSTPRAARHRRPKPVQQHTSTASVPRRPGARPRAASRYSSYSRPRRHTQNKYPPNASRSGRPPHGRRGDSAGGRSSHGHGHGLKPKLLRKLTGKAADSSDSGSDSEQEDDHRVGDYPEGEGVFGSGLSWDQIGRIALEAGTIAALKVHSSPGKWVGDKGAKVATAAVSAALVDSFLSKKKPKAKGGIRHATIRQVTEMALGNMVLGPAIKKAGAAGARPRGR